MSHYPNLFSPLKIGTKTLRNRVYFTSHGMAMPVQGVIGERYRNYLVERAKGGVAAIVTQSAPVHPSSGESPTNMHLWREESLPEYAKLSEELHRYDTLGLVMLWHQGHVGSSRFNRQALVAPSAIAAPGADELPKALELAEIDQLIEYYARCARFAFEGGMDGVQVQTSADYLLGSFLSPVLNQRTDQYGGSLENRMRLIVQILEAIRRETAPDFIVAIRTTASHLMKEGWGLEEAKIFARKLATSKLINFIDVIVGSYFSSAQLIPAYALERGYTADYATAIREVVDVPVATAGRIVEPERAEKMLAEGVTDLIGLARPLIADPEWVNKTRQGRKDDIRLCISCNQGCIAPIAQGRAGGCLVNPAAGFETTLGTATFTPVSTSKNVLVVGGGLAGLEAARTATGRGHKVTIWEKADKLGGQWLKVAGVSAFKEFANLTDYLLGQIQKLKIEVKLNQTATTEQILAADFDTVILATGAYPDRYGQGRIGGTIKGLDLPHVVDGRDIFGRELGQNLILFDQIGNYESIATAYALLEGGKNLTIVTPSPAFASATLTATWNMGSVYSDLFKAGAVITPLTTLTEIEQTSVTLQHIYTGSLTRLNQIENVVLLRGYLPDENLYFALKGKLKELYRIGDCIAPRSAQLAILEGQQIGREI
jgi:2,4-dienoyl-CoA reductase (NADPH2)